MPHHPAHIDGYVRDATHRFSEEADAFHFFYQVACPCGSLLFKARKSQCESLEVECKTCGKIVSVYNLAEYPAATKLDKAEELLEISLPDGTTHGSIFVMYEYGELDEDQDFDRNDITWCGVWLEASDQSLVLILDDETA